MKVYTLTIVYDENTDEIEFIEEEVTEDTSETDPAEAVAEDEVLENAEASDEATLSAADETDAEEHADMMVALADYLDKTIHRK